MAQRIPLEDQERAVKEWEILPKEQWGKETEWKTCSSLEPMEAERECIALGLAFKMGPVGPSWTLNTS